MPNSAAVIVIAVMPLLAISRPLAKTAASLVVTAPVMVTEFALKASSAKNPVTAASASVNVMESIWSALNLATLATIAALAPAEVIAPLVSVTESAATAASAINAAYVLTAPSSAKVIAVTPPSFTFATFAASQSNTSVFDTEPETVTESAAKEAILVAASVFAAVNIFRISVSVNSAFAIDPAVIPNPARSVFASTLSLALGCTSKVPVPVNPPASWISLKSAISTTKVEFKVTPPTLLSEMPVAITLPSDTTSVPPARSITLPAFKVMVSSLSFDMSNVSVPPSRSTLIVVETAVTVPAPASVAFIVTFPAPEAFSPFASI